MRIPNFLKKLLPDSLNFEVGAKVFTTIKREAGRRMDRPSNQTEVEENPPNPPIVEEPEEAGALPAEIQAENQQVDGQLIVVQQVAGQQDAGQQVAAGPRPGEAIQLPATVDVGFGSTSYAGLKAHYGDHFSAGVQLQANTKSLITDGARLKKPDAKLLFLVETSLGEARIEPKQGVGEVWIGSKKQEIKEGVQIQPDNAAVVTGGRANVRLGIKTSYSKALFKKGEKNDAVVLPTEKDQVGELVAGATSNTAENAEQSVMDSQTQSVGVVAPGNSLPIALKQEAQPVTNFLTVFAAFWLVTVAALGLGNRAAHKLSKDPIFLENLDNSEKADSPPGSKSLETPKKQESPGNSGSGKIFPN